MVSKKRKEDEFELVPEAKYHELEAKVDKINQSPFVSVAGVDKISYQLEGTQDSILGLLEVLKQIAKASDEEVEKNFMKNQLKPFVKELGALKQQNETLANSMIEIINKLNSIEQNLSSNKLRASSTPNPNLPPLEGGPTPPNNFDPNKPMPDLDTNFYSSPIKGNEFPSQDSANLPPPLEGKPVEPFPPLKKHKKGFFK